MQILYLVLRLKDMILMLGRRTPSAISTGAIVRGAPKTNRKFVLGAPLILSTEIASTKLLKECLSMIDTPGQTQLLC